MSYWATWATGSGSTRTHQQRRWAIGLCTSCRSNRFCVSCEPKLHRQRQDVGIRAASGCRSGRPPGAATCARVYTHNLIFLGEPQKGSQHCFILLDILFRGNYVTNRCPGSARNSGSAAAGPGNGSRLVKCQRRPRHWISTEPTARRSTYRFAEPERVKQYIKIGTSFALAGFR